MNKQQNDVINLGKLLGVFWDHRRTIIYSTVLFAVLGLTYALLTPAVYTANSSVQVDEKYTGGALKELSSIFEQESTAGAEVEVIKSRAVLSRAVEELNLTTEISPIYPIPFISKKWEAIAGEKPELTIPYFIPKKEELDKVVISIDSPTEYSVMNEDGDLLLKGSVGQKYNDDNLEIQVTHLKGDEGKKFSVEKLDELKVIAALQKDINVIERGKQTGVIELSLNGENKDYIAAVLRSVTNSYLYHSTVRNSAEAEKSLSFLEKRLPEVRSKLAESENALNEYRQKHSAVDLGMEAKAILDTLVQLEENLNSLTIRESEVAQRFTKRHPTYVALLEQRQTLLNEKKRLSKQLEALPATQKDIVRLTRDFEADQATYVQLLNKSQELSVVKAGAVGNVRLLDQARALPDPIAPRKLLILVFSMLAGFIIGSTVVTLRYLSLKGIKTLSETAETGLTIYAAIPHSKKQLSLDKSRAAPQTANLLSNRYADDLSCEALRGLRTASLFMLTEAENNLIMLSGVAQAAGKSFISSNLTNVLAQTGKKVLLIDADLRLGHLHNILGSANNSGLSDLLAQNTAFEQSVQLVSNNFHLITRGSKTENPSELLSSARCRQLLDWASANYDIVVISAPPVLPVTDASIIGRYAGTNLLIGRFEKTSKEEIKASRQRFENAGVPIKGLILNDLKYRTANGDDYLYNVYGTAKA